MIEKQSGYICAQQFARGRYALRVTSTSHGHARSKTHRIQLNLRDVNQLFNTMDPSPFNERDLDHDAEEFIVSWARELPLAEPVVLVIHLAALPREPDAQKMIQESIHHYFNYRLELSRREFRHLMHEGRKALVIGLLFLASCLTASKLLFSTDTSALSSVGRESLTIAGWVAMWRPMEIYLYDWWPLLRHRKILQKLSRIPVELRVPKVTSD
jgi:hypothetical protein